MTLGLGDGEALGVAVGLGFADGDGLGVGLDLGEAFGVGELEAGLGAGESVGTGEGLGLGSGDVSDLGRLAAITATTIKLHNTIATIPDTTKMATGFDLSLESIIVESIANRAHRWVLKKVTDREAAVPNETERLWSSPW